MPYLFLLIGVIIGGVIFGWLKYKKQDTNRRSEIPLKKTGKRIIVYFDKCVIKTRDYFEGATSNTMPSRIDMLDSLYNPNQEMNKIKKSVSVIVFNWMDGSGRASKLNLEANRFICLEKVYVLI